MVELITFITLSTVTLVSAILVITRRNAVHSAIWLIVTLFFVGGIFLLQHAEFLFAVQIILYVGGIMVLFLFVVMLVDIDVALKQARFARQWLVALVTSVLLAAIVGYALYNHGNGLNLPTRPMTSAPVQNTQAVGMALYQNYMLPVEIASILLLVAMVGGRDHGQEETAMIPSEYYIFLGTGLFAIGVVGVLTRRNVLILMSIELILNAVNINLMAFSQYLNRWMDRFSRFSLLPTPPPKPRLDWA